MSRDTQETIDWFGRVQSALSSGPLSMAELRRRVSPDMPRSTFANRIKTLAARKGYFRITKVSGIRMVEVAS